MVRFIIGRAGSGKSTEVQRLVERVIRETDACAVVIVPEQQTVVWETKMASMLPDSANLRVEITNFTRLANSVFREYGGLADTPIDDGSRALLVWRAMLETAPALRVYGAGEENNPTRVRLDRNIPRMTKAIDELKNSGISPAEAERALDLLIAETEESGLAASQGLAARLGDAVRVYAAYSNILSESRIDRTDLLAKLGEALARHPYFKGKYVFVDSFFSLTAAEEKILTQIMRQAEETTVTFACPAEDNGEIQFAEVFDFLKKAKLSAARAGCETETVRLVENFRHKNAPPLADIERYIFDYTADLPTERSNPRDCVRIIKCADRYDEAEACAAIIDRLVREGYSYSDIAVVAADMKSREGVVDAVLRRHGIRCFMSESTEVSSSPAVRLIFSALRVAESGWARDDIIKMVKTGLTPLSRGGGTLSAEDVFEAYTETWNIRGHRMYTADAWSMNPEGYKLEMSDTSREILAAVNDAKEKLIPPLDRLLSVFDGGIANVRDIAERIVYFAEDYGVYSALLRMADSYRRIGMSADARKCEGMWGAVCKILDKMTAALDGMYLDAGTFGGLFLRVASSMDVGSIPTGVDEVVLGSASGIRVDSVKCVIMLGSVEGEFPSQIDSGRDFFDDRDRIALEGVGLKLSSPDSTMRGAREYFMYYRTAAAPSERLYVLAPMSGEAQLSDGALRISKIVGANPVTFSEMPLSEAVYTRAAAEYQLARRNTLYERELLGGLCERSECNEIPLTAEKENVGALHGAGEVLRMNLSESRLESFASCPFLYSCKYLAKLKPQAKAEINMPDIGTFVHSVVERFFTELTAEELQSMPLSRERTEELADSVIRDYIRSLSAASGSEGELDGRLGYLFVRLRRHVLIFLEAIMRELSQSSFRPVAYELPIGLGGGVKPIIFEFTDGSERVEVVLRGIADRVDMYSAPSGEKYVRVIDYKTGAKSFSLDDVYRGIGVQLLIYLFSVWKSGIEGVDGELIPAGAVYLGLIPTPQSSSGLISADEARELAIDAVSRRGILLADEAVLSAMDAELDGKYIGIKRAADGSLKCTSASTTLADAEAFGSLFSALSDVISGIAAKIKRGDADAKPASVAGRSPCDWCDMKFICRKPE